MLTSCSTWPPRSHISEYVAPICVNPPEAALPVTIARFLDPAEIALKKWAYLKSSKNRPFWYWNIWFWGFPILVYFHIYMSIYIYTIYTPWFFNKYCKHDDTVLSRMPIGMTSISIYYIILSRRIKVKISFSPETTALEYLCANLGIISRYSVLVSHWGFGDVFKILLATAIFKW